MTKLEAAIIILERLKKEKYDNLIEIVDDKDEKKSRDKENNKRKRKRKSSPNFLQSDILKVIDLFLNLLKEKMLEGEKIEFRGFGTFGRRLRNPRKSVNPKTKKMVELEYRYIPFFKPSREFKLLFREKIDKFEK